MWNSRFFGRHFEFFFGYIIIQACQLTIQNMCKIASKIHIEIEYYTKYIMQHLHMHQYVACFLQEFHETANLRCYRITIEYYRINTGITVLFKDYYCNIKITCKLHCTASTL